MPKSNDGWTGQYRRAIDKYYFTESLWWLDRPMNFLQRKIAKSVSKQVAVLGARQIFGKTQVTAISEVLHPMIYIPNFQVLIATDRLVTSQKFANKVVEAFEYFKSTNWSESKDLSITINNTTALTLSNRSHIECVSGEQRSPKGITSDLIVFDEAAYIYDNYYDKARKTAMARPEARYIALTTPNGKQGWFYNLWMKAEQARLDGKIPAWETIYAIDDDCDWLPKSYFEAERAEAKTDAMYRQEMKCEFLDIERAAFSIEQFEKVSTGEYEEWE